MDNKRPTGILEPSLCPPRIQDEHSDNYVYSRHDNSKMVRGEILYKTKEKGNPA